MMQVFGSLNKKERGEKNMDLRKIVIGIVSISILLIWIGGALAIPQKISYQGKLTDSSGNPVTGNYSIVFTIYDAASDGSNLWTETRTVPVTKGIYHIVLGEDTAIGTSVFNGDERWLGVKVGSDSEMTPRLKIVSVGNAYRAYNAENLDGKDSGEFIQLGPATQQSTTAAIGVWVKGADLGGSFEATGGVGIYAKGDSGGWFKATGTGKYGVYSESELGDGVFGKTSGTRTGVRGETDSGKGVYGRVSGVSGGIGVYGDDSCISNGIGVYGESFGGIGVRGKGPTAGGSFEASGSGKGVYGESPSGPGVHGVTSGTGYAGVWGETRVAGGTGVWGSAPVGGGYGVYGWAPGEGGYGVYGTSGSGSGVYGDGRRAFEAFTNHPVGILYYGSHEGDSGSLIELKSEGSTKFEVSLEGTVSATSFVGDGSGLTGITATNADTVDGIHASTEALANRLYPLDASARFALSSSSSQFTIKGENTGSGSGLYGWAGASSGKGVEGVADVENGAGVWGQASSSTGIGVYGTGATGGSFNATGSGKGVYAYSPSGIGVHGKGPTAGGSFESTSTGPGVYAKAGTGYAGYFNGKVYAKTTDGTAVYGSGYNDIGVNGYSFNGDGVYGRGYWGYGLEGFSDQGLAVYGKGWTGGGSFEAVTYGAGVYGKSGYMSSLPGVLGIGTSGHGVKGVTQKSNYAGVFGEGIVSICTGVWGNSENGKGVMGTTWGSGGLGIGVYGSSEGGTGVRGEGYRYGVYGINTSGMVSNSYPGVYGESYGPGVYGVSTGTGQVGVYGQNLTDNSYGVIGLAQNGIGVFGACTTGKAVSGNSFSDIGVYGKGLTAGGSFESSGAGPGVYVKAGSGLAGKFEGDVNITGDVTVTGIIDATAQSIKIWNHTPASSSEAGSAGLMSYDENYLYIWVAADNVKRVGLSNW